MKKMFFISAAVAVLFLIFGCTQEEKIIIEPEKPIIVFTGYDLPDGNCNFNSIGWGCVIDNYEEYEEHYFDRNSIAVKNFYEKKNYFYNYCNTQDGFFNYSIFSEQYVFCYFPFPDENKICDSSNYCYGSCIIDKEYMEKNFPDQNYYKSIKVENIRGHCSKYSIRCGLLYDYNRGIVKKNLIMCD